MVSDKQCPGLQCTFLLVVAVRRRGVFILQVRASAAVWRCACRRRAADPRVTRWCLRRRSLVPAGDRVIGARC